MIPGSSEIYSSLSSDRSPMDVGIDPCKLFDERFLNKI